MKNRVITISREFGSGGRTIGKKLAEKLGIPCYDSELIHKIALESGFTENYIKDAGEYAPGGFLSSALSNRSFGPTNEDYLWEIQYKIITELAEKESALVSKNMLLSDSKYKVSLSGVTVVSPLVVNTAKFELLADSPLPIIVIPPPPIDIP